MIKIFWNQAELANGIDFTSLNMLRTSDFTFLKQILWYVDAVLIENIFF